MYLISDKIQFKFIAKRGCHAISDENRKQKTALTEVTGVPQLQSNIEASHCRGQINTSSTLLLNLKVFVITKKRMKNVLVLTGFNEFCQKCDLCLYFLLTVFN